MTICHSTLGSFTVKQMLTGEGKRNTKKHSTADVKQYSGLLGYAWIQAERYWVIHFFFASSALTFQECIYGASLELFSPAFMQRRHFSTHVWYSKMCVPQNVKKISQVNQIWRAFCKCPEKCNGNLKPSGMFIWVCDCCPRARCSWNIGDRCFKLLFPVGCYEKHVLHLPATEQTSAAYTLKSPLEYKIKWGVWRELV